MSDVYRRTPPAAADPNSRQPAWWSAHPPFTRQDLASWWPELVSGSLVLISLMLRGATTWWGAPYGLFFGGRSIGTLLLACSLLAASVLWRRQPGIALGLVWVCGFLALLGGFPPPLAGALVCALVSFGCARYGSTAVLWSSAVSIAASMLVVVAAAVLGARYAYGSVTSMVVDSAGTPLGVVTEVSHGVGSVFGWARYAVRTGLSPLQILLFALMAWLFLLIAPWLLGFSLRSQRGQREAEVQRAVYQQAHVESQHREAQAKEVAELKESQARLARDVHDVVGHSLAVILAQAESAQYLPKRDLAGRDQVLTNIATSARQSLQDVREVLGRTQDGATVSTEATTISLDRLVEGVRSAGNDVRSTIEGQPQPLPPELESVAYRVLQEMLTNALKHGTRGGPVWVEQHWEGDLRLEVRNVIADSPANEETMPIQAEVEAADAMAAEEPGLGLAGMRSRLEAVGGRLDVRRRQEPGVGMTYTATAWMPMRAAG